MRVGLIRCAAALALLLAFRARIGMGGETPALEEKAAFIPVHGEIDRTLVVFVRRGIERRR